MANLVQLYSTPEVTQAFHLESTEQSDNNKEDFVVQFYSFS